MKKSHVIIVTALVLALGIPMLSVYGAFRASAASEEQVASVTAAAYKQRTGIVSTNGSGNITVTPDIAYISLGIETSGKDSVVAQRLNMDQMNKLIAEIKKLGIRDEDIQTQGYTVYPDYQWTNNKSVLVGYRTTNTLKITVRNLGNCGIIIDTAADNGANLINGIQFDVADTEKLYQDALLLAIKDAKDKANLMVGYFGIKTVKPVEIRETSSNSRYYPIYDASFVKGEAIATPVSPGQIEIIASVSIDFEY